MADSHHVDPIGDALGGGNGSGTAANTKNNNNNNNNNKRGGGRKKGGQQRHQQGDGGGGASNHPHTAMSNNSNDKDVSDALYYTPYDESDSNYIECNICTEPCRALCVFDCGHYTCYSCGLRIYTLEENKACPICREKSGPPLVTRRSPYECFNEEELRRMLETGAATTERDAERDQFSPFDVALWKKQSIRDSKLQCCIDTLCDAAAAATEADDARDSRNPTLVRSNRCATANELADEMAKLYLMVCPLPDCFCQETVARDELASTLPAHKTRLLASQPESLLRSSGAQEPFSDLRALCDHLHTRHNRLHYCNICTQNRPVFLCERALYNDAQMRQHIEGACEADSASFTGHPPCKFCTKKKIQQQQQQNRNGNNSGHGHGGGARIQTHFYDGEALMKHMQSDHYTCDVCNRNEFTFTFFEDRTRLSQHFVQSHHVCEHTGCAGQDLMLRVFATELDLAAHQQRAHGVRAQLTFGSIGASDGSGGTGSGGGGLGGGNYNHNNNNFTRQGNTGSTILVTFDFVNHTETVNLMPLRGGKGGGGGGRRNHGGAGGGAAGLITTACGTTTATGGVWVPLREGLPVHYMSAAFRRAFLRYHPPADAAAAKKKKASAPSGLPAPGDSKTTDGKTDAAAPAGAVFGVQETRDEYSATHRVPRNAEAAKEELNRLIEERLVARGRQGDLERFKHLTRDFMESRLLTAEYYTRVQQEVFPDPSDLHAVFPLLVASVPVDEKRRALQEVYKMKTTPELRRVAAAAEEDRKKAQSRSVWDEIEAQRRSAGSGNSGGGSKNKRGTERGWKQIATPTANVKPAANNNTGAAASAAGKGKSAKPEPTAAQRLAMLKPRTDSPSSPPPPAAAATTTSTPAYKVTVAAATPANNSVHGGGGVGAGGVRVAARWGSHASHSANARPAGAAAASPTSATAGGAAAAAAAPTLQDAYGNSNNNNTNRNDGRTREELFPSLPDNTTQVPDRYGLNDKKKKPGANAWFRK